MFLKDERDQMLWGKQNVQSLPQAIGCTRLPHLGDADRDGGKSASTFGEIFDTLALILAEVLSEH